MILCRRMYTERILREGKRDTFLELDSHIWPERVQCQVRGSILRRSNTARHLKTLRHMQCKYVWTDRFEITRFRDQANAP